MKDRGRHKPLPKLLPGWTWRLRLGEPHNGMVSSTLAACLFTPDQDCYVYPDKGSLCISTGTAPIEIVAAVLATIEPSNAKTNEEKPTTNSP